MIILELFEPLPNGHHTEKEDNTTLRLRDLRKTRLSLEQINRMRVMNDVRKLEHERKLEKVHKQYKAPSPDGGGGPGSPAGL
jgi:hypothetical protein